MIYKNMCELICWLLLSASEKGLQNMLDIVELPMFGRVWTPYGDRVAAVRFSLIAVSWLLYCFSLSLSLSLSLCCIPISIEWYITGFKFQKTKRLVTYAKKTCNLLQDLSFNWLVYYKIWNLCQMLEENIQISDWTEWTKFEL